MEVWRKWLASSSRDTQQVKIVDKVKSQRSKYGGGGTKAGVCCVG